MSTTGLLPARFSPVRWSREVQVLVLTLVGIGAIAAFPLFAEARWLMNIAFFTLMFAALGTSWNLVAGYTGYISLGTIAFFGLGAYGFAWGLDHGGIEGTVVPFLLVPLIGIAVGLASVPLAFIAFRTRGSVFILVTITYVLMFEYLAFNLTGITQGSRGYRVPLPSLGIGTFEVVFFEAMLIVLAVGLLICWYLRSAPIGLAMFAVRDDEDRAAGIGVLTAWPKYMAFGLAAFLAGMVGALWAYRIGYIYPQFAFDPGPLLIGTVLVALFGGIGTLWGPTVGAFILIPLEQELAFRLGGRQLYLLVYVLIFIAVMRLLPRGILPTISNLLARLRRTRAASNHAVDEGMGTSAEPAHGEVPDRALLSVGSDGRERR